jgi:hypothetical protein
MRNLSILQNFRATQLRLTPFPHFIIDNALPEDLYKNLEREYPFETQLRGYSGFGNNLRYQMSAVDGLRENRLSPLWKEFVSYHTSRDFYCEVLTAFGESIKTIYPQITLDLQRGVRFLDDQADVWIDCQPGINSPVSRVNSVKGPHLDHPSEIFAGLLYFRHPEDDSTGGDLEIFEYKKRPFKFHGQRFIEAKFVRKIGSVPYKRNHFFMFLNTLDSVHGVSPRSKTIYTRRLVNFIGEVGHGDVLFNIPTQSSLFGRGMRLLSRKLGEIIK